MLVVAVDRLVDQVLLQQEDLMMVMVVDHLEVVLDHHNLFLRDMFKELLVVLILVVVAEAALVTNQVVQVAQEE
jgi:hypothetical protein